MAKPIAAGDPNVFDSPEQAPFICPKCNHKFRSLHLHSAEVTGMGGGPGHYYPIKSVRWEWIPCILCKCTYNPHVPESMWKKSTDGNPPAPDQPVEDTSGDDDDRFAQVARYAKSMWGKKR